MSTTSIPKISPIACDLIPDWRKKTSEIDDVKFSKSIFRRTMLPKAKLRTPLDFPRHSAYDRHFLCKMVALKLDLNPRPGGEGHFDHPLQFFADSAKTAARSAAVFGTPYLASFPHLIWKFQVQVTSGQVTRSGQVISPPKMFAATPRLQFSSDQYET